MLKKLFAATAALGVMLFSTSAFAAVRGNDAVEAAKTKLPESIVVMGYDEGQDTAIVNFRDTDSLLDYAVEVSLETGKVLKMDVEGASIHGSTIITKSFEDIEAIVLSEYPNAQEMIITTGQDGNNTYYDVVFTTDEYAAELKVNPVTGAFSEREYVFF
ncbi:MAG: hypothetical protein IJX10_04795 [Phascolarctobacterium sp.]|nr:hypothetical protein [Phascolarctobacterium sp.]